MRLTLPTKHLIIRGDGILQFGKRKFFVAFVHRIEYLQRVDPQVPKLVKRFAITRSAHHWRCRCAAIGNSADSRNPWDRANIGCSRSVAVTFVAGNLLDHLFGLESVH